MDCASARGIVIHCPLNRPVRCNDVGMRKPVLRRVRIYCAVVLLHLSGVFVKEAAAATQTSTESGAYVNLSQPFMIHNPERARAAFVNVARTITTMTLFRIMIKARVASDLYKPI